MPDSTANLAVLIDADNSRPAAIDALLDEAAKYGTASVKRVYGDWTTDQLKGWKKVLPEHAIQPIQQFANTKGKNATDSAMIIDAMDLLYTGRFDGFCLVTSDSDFTRLASRIRENGVMVYGFGERKTPSPFVKSCDRFVYVDALIANVPSGKAAKSKAPTAAKPSPEGDEGIKRFKGNSGLIKALRKAIADLSDEDGWASLGPVGSQVQAAHSDFDPRNYGFAKLSDLLHAVDLFEVKKRDKSVQIRDSKAK
ncbi:conserved hypothetical protein [Haloferula helveola]|uniref:HTH OST-type domain-containing protein n=1 Tax=Haloferula helveola TaxID=490095 RepID=A0ABM7RNP6_9BACT|nr:conserved hypothetical protein [Haloferula helveola]